MADNPITVQLPADLPEDWEANDIVAPDGADAGLSEQHGYNYLMEQVNAAQKAAQELGQAFANLIATALIGQPNGVASLDSGGKIPSSQLPALNYDPAGSAAAVQGNLNSHTSNRNNPHGVTASQVGADPAGSAAAVQTNLTSHINDKSNPHSVTAAQIGAVTVETGSITISSSSSSLVQIDFSAPPKIILLSFEYNGKNQFIAAPLFYGQEYLFVAGFTSAGGTDAVTATVTWSSSYVRVAFGNMFLRGYVLHYALIS